MNPASVLSMRSVVVTRRWGTPFFLLLSPVSITAAHEHFQENITRNSDRSVDCRF